MDKSGTVGCKLNASFTILLVSIHTILHLQRIDYYSHRAYNIFSILHRIVRNIILSRFIVIVIPNFTFLAGLRSQVIVAIAIFLYL